MKNNTNILTEKIKSTRSLFKQAVLFCSFLLLFTGTLFSQENPWETTKPKGENPWATETEKKEPVVEATPDITTTPDTTAIAIQTEPVETSVPVQTPNAETEPVQVEANEAALNSTATVRQFNINGQEIKLNTNNYNYYRELKHHGKMAHSANIGFGVGIATGSIFSILALPVNLIGSVVPSYKTDRLKDNFAKNNPHATEKEKKAFSKGVSEKRVGRALGGNLIGIGINLVAIFVIAFI